MSLALLPSLPLSNLCRKSAPIEPELDLRPKPKATVRPHPTETAWFLYGTLGPTNPAAPLHLVNVSDVVIAAAKDGGGGASYLRTLLQYSPSALAAVRGSHRSRQAADW